MDRNIKEAMRGKKRKLDLSTERRCEMKTLRADTRYWEPFCRGQYIDGFPKGMYDLINPWIMASHGPSQTPHNENTGRPNQYLMYKEFVPNALKLSAPPRLEECYKRAVHTMALEIREVTGKVIEGSTCVHAFDSKRKAPETVEGDGETETAKK